MAQYDADLPVGLPGQVYDLNPSQKESYIAEGDIPFGIAVVEGTAINQAKEPAATSLAKDIRGVTLRTHALQNVALAGAEDAYSDEEIVDVISKGRVWVNVEHAVTTGDRVYVRTTAGGAEQAGEFRADGDGTAQVTTVTPTAANSTAYRLQIHLDDGRQFEFQITSDTNATATEICNAFRTLIAAQGELTGLVTGSGTSTLILTGDKGVGFQVLSANSAGTLAVALTTALASDCVLLPNARYVVEGSVYAVVELS